MFTSLVSPKLNKKQFILAQPNVSTHVGEFQSQFLINESSRNSIYHTLHYITSHHITSHYGRIHQNKYPVFVRFTVPELVIVFEFGHIKNYLGNRTNVTMIKDLNSGRQKRAVCI